MTANRPYVVGLTGSVASGKSSLAQALARRGVCVIDADRIARRLEAPGGPAERKIRVRFGEAVYTDGVLDRTKLGALVFSCPRERRALNAIVHPLVAREIERRLSGLRRVPAVLMDVPLLFESGLNTLCDEVWCTRASLRQQVLRLRRRNGLGLHQALARVRSQMASGKKARRCDRVINTNLPLKQSVRHIRSLWKTALRRANHA